jgi:hypothetical protein
MRRLQHNSGLVYVPNNRRMSTKPLGTFDLQAAHILTYGRQENSGQIAHICVCTLAPCGASRLSISQIRTPGNRLAMTMGTTSGSTVNGTERLGRRSVRTPDHQQGSSEDDDADQVPMRQFPVRGLCGETIAHFISATASSVVSTWLAM